MPRDVIPAEPGWIALWRDKEGNVTQYPVIAWERTDFEEAMFVGIVMNGRCGIRRGELEEDDWEDTRFLGYRHPVHYPGYSEKSDAKS